MTYDPDNTSGGYDAPLEPYDEFYGDRFTMCPAEGCTTMCAVGTVLEHLIEKHYPHRVPSTFDGKQPENIEGQLEMVTIPCPGGGTITCTSEQARAYHERWSAD